MSKKEFLDTLSKLPTDDQELVIGMMQILMGEIPENPLIILHLNRHAILMQRKGMQLPVGTMPLLAGLALNIIDGVTDLADRHILMSYFLHVNDTQEAKVPDVLKRNNFVL